VSLVDTSAAAGDLLARVSLARGRPLDSLLSMSNEQGAGGTATTDAIPRLTPSSPFSVVRGLVLRLVRRWAHWGLIAFFLSAAGCHRTETPEPRDAASTVSMASDSGGGMDPDAAHAGPGAEPTGTSRERPTCAEPRALTQLQTHRPPLEWLAGDILFDGKRAFDPATMASIPVPPRPEEPSLPPRLPQRMGGDTLERRGAFLARVGPDGTVRFRTPLRPSETFATLENGRWLVIDAGQADDASTLYRVVDGDRGVPIGGRFVSVRGDVALVARDLGVRATNLASGKRLADVDACAAGGAVTFSLSDDGRFVICDSTRLGSTYTEVLHPKNDFGVSTSALFSGDGAYMLDTSSADASTDNALVADVSRLDLNAWKGRIVAKDIPATDAATGMTQTLAVPLAICGRGELFAIVGRRELSVYRGDGSRVASAPAMHGGVLAFSASGTYVMQSRAGASTIYRLEVAE
jgi:hypothetical protein